MNARVKRKWVRALRSGEYEQGRSSLCHVRATGVPGRYCCLGVLVDEMAPEFFREGRKDPGGWWAVIVQGREDSTVVIPDDLAITWGLSTSEQETLVNLNDRGVSFPLIANWIDENL